MDLLSSVAIDDQHLVFGLADGRYVAAPIGWFPKLASAKDKQKKQFKLSPYGVHWPELDEDVSVQGILHGASPSRWDVSAKNELLSALERLVESNELEKD